MPKIIIPLILSLLVSTAWFLSALQAGELGGTTKYRIGDHTLYIPEAFLSTRLTNVSDKGGTIQAYYPGNIPLPDTPSNLDKKGEWGKNISILFQDISQMERFTPEKLLPGFIKLYDTTDEIGKRYGLVHLHRPPASDNNFRKEIYVESSPEDITSLILCDENVRENKRIPVCIHYFHRGPFSYQVRYRKPLLPDWKLIKLNVTGLLDSFSSTPSLKRSEGNKSLKQESDN